MHSFHQSRGRVLFEVFCALTVAASCFGAWLQSGTWALLPAAAVVSLYGLVHAFDLRRQKPIEHQVAARDAEPVADDAPKLAEAAVIAEPIEVVAPRAVESRRAKTPRKSGARGGTKKAKVTQAAPVEAAEIAAPVTLEDVEAAVPVAFEDVAPVPLAPLFEPEPFVRMPRPAFGRKAG